MFKRSVIFWICVFSMLKICLLFHQSVIVWVVSVKSIVTVRNSEKSMNINKSVMSHCFVIKRWRKLFNSWPTVFQVVTYVMSHLNNNCQKQKHFRFSDVRYKRRSIVKEVQVLLVMSTALLHQQSDNSCKIEHEKLYEVESLFMWCHILPLASHVTSEWMDVTVFLTCHFPTLTSLRVQVGLVSPHHQKCHLCCHRHPQLNGVLQDFASVVLSWVDTEACSHYVIFLLSVLSEFSSVTSESLSSIGLILSLSTCCVWSSYMRMLWFWQYHRRDKKLKLHLGEFGIEWAVHLLPVTANLMGNHNWRLLYGMPTPLFLQQEPLYRRAALSLW
jgi:hypothetical protein